MPMPARTSPLEFFEHLEEHQQPHLRALRNISHEFSDHAVEELRWNMPAYICDGTNLWMLQAFKNHCSLRFTPAFMKDHHDAVHEAGYESGAGFLKILYTEPVPEALARQLIQARITDFRDTQEVKSASTA